MPCHVFYKIIKFSQPNCTSCDGPSNTINCLSCADGLYLMAKACIEDCSFGFYNNAIDNTCTACNPLCNKDCIGPADTECIQCNDTLKLFQG